MKPRPCILILYTELAGYILNCLRQLPHAGFDVHVIAWPVNSEAPFDVSVGYSSGINFYDRNSFNRKELISFAQKIKPEIILCSGWIDKDYLAVCAVMRKTSQRILALDNKWQATLKQRVISTAGRTLVHRCFSHCWVPGPEQHLYARKLGFGPEQILEGFYAADTAYFQRLHDKYLPEKMRNLPRRYLYVGRYIDFKGIQDLWEAYQQRSNTNWELWCVGTGPLFAEKPEATGIRHFGFVQPGQLDKFVRETSVFILPSRVEPWGVALHEFAAAGFPLLCSDQVGSATVFIQDETNGFIFPSNDPKGILAAMNKIENLETEKLLNMGEISTRLASEITPEFWLQSLLSVLKIKA